MAQDGTRNIEDAMTVGRRVKWWNALSGIELISQQLWPSSISLTFNYQPQ